MRSNTILIIVAVIAIIFAIYYLNKNNDQPIPNNGTINSLIQGEKQLSNNNQFYDPTIKNLKKFSTNTSSDSVLSNSRPINPHAINTRLSDEMSNNAVDELIMQYDTSSAPFGDNDCVSPSDPMADKYGAFRGYGEKRQINLNKMEMPFSDSEYDSRDFSYKKKTFTKGNPEDIKDLFNIDKMLPKEIEADWFDTVPLEYSKKIKGTSLIHPKVHMGVNTVGTSKKYATHDLRGDIPNPKLYISPWLNSSIEPDTNIKGLCNAI